MFIGGESGWREDEEVAGEMDIINDPGDEMYVNAVGDGVDEDGRMDGWTDGHIMYDPRFGVLVVGVRVRRSGIIPRGRGERYVLPPL